MTHIRDHHHFLGHNVVQDEGEGHLIIIIQQRVDGFLQPHQPVLLLRIHTHIGLRVKVEIDKMAGICEKRQNIYINTHLFQFSIAQVKHGLCYLCYWMFCPWWNKKRAVLTL